MSGRRAGRPAPRMSLLGIALAPILVHFDLSAVSVGFPLIEQTFGPTSHARLSWVLNGFAIVFAALLVPAGQLADTLGRRRVLKLGLSLFFVASTACALAGSVALLVAARMMQAVGAAFVVPSSLGLMIAALPASHRGRATGAWSAAAAVGGALGFFIGGAVGSASGWRAMLFAEVPLGLLALHAANRARMPRDLLRRTKPDAAGALLLAAGIGGLTLGIVRSPGWGIASPGTLLPFAASAILLAIFVRRCRRQAHPVLELSLLRLRSFAASAIGVFCFASAFYALQFAYSLFLLRAWGVTPLAAGLMLTPGPLVAVVAATASGRWADRSGPGPVAMVGTSVFALGCLAFALGVHDEPVFATDFLPGLLLVSIGIGLSFTSLTAMGVRALPAHRLSTGVAMIASIRQLGGALGVAALLGGLQTTVTDDLAAFRIIYVTMALVGIGAGAAAVATQRGNWGLAPNVRAMRAFVTARSIRARSGEVRLANPAHGRRLTERKRRVKAPRQEQSRASAAHWRRVATRSSSVRARV
jgi:EmrB/QacA subfamily drug resistance transporter